MGPIASFPSRNLQDKIECLQAKNACDQSIDELVKKYMQELPSQGSYSTVKGDLAYISTFLKKNALLPRSLVVMFPLFALTILGVKLVLLSQNETLKKQINFCNSLFKDGGLQKKCNPFNSLSAETIGLIAHCLNIQDRAKFFRATQEVAGGLREIHRRAHFDVNNRILEMQNILQRLDPQKYTTQIEALQQLVPPEKLNSILLNKNEQRAILNGEMYKILKRIWRTDSQVQDCEEIALLVLSQDPIAFRHVSSNLKANPDFMLKATSQNNRALEFSAGTVKNEFIENEIVLAAVQQNGLALQYVPNHVNNEIILVEVQQNGPALHFANGDELD